MYENFVIAFLSVVIYITTLVTVRGWLITYRIAVNEERTLGYNVLKCVMVVVSAPASIVLLLMVLIWHKLVNR